MNSPVFSHIHRAINDRLDAVEELATSNSTFLPKMRDLLKSLPDLERGITSIYNKRVGVVIDMQPLTDHTADQCSTSEFLYLMEAVDSVHALFHSHARAADISLHSQLLKSIIQVKNI